MLVAVDFFRIQQPAYINKQSDLGNNSSRRATKKQFPETLALD